MLPVRTCWWENPLQVETLAALAAWVERYDSGEWDDPPGKLALLYDLERVAALLRDGNDPFYPDRDRAGVQALPGARLAWAVRQCMCAPGGIGTNEPSYSMCMSWVRGGSMRP